MYRMTKLNNWMKGILFLYKTIVVIKIQENIIIIAIKRHHLIKCNIFCPNQLRKIRLLFWGSLESVCGGTWGALLGYWYRPSRTRSVLDFTTKDPSEHKLRTLIFEIAILLKGSKEWTEKWKLRQKLKWNLRLGYFQKIGS